MAKPKVNTPSPEVLKHSHKVMGIIGAIFAWISYSNLDQTNRTWASIVIFVGGIMVGIALTRIKIIKTGK